MNRFAASLLALASCATLGLAQEGTNGKTERAYPKTKPQACDEQKQKCQDNKYSEGKCSEKENKSGACEGKGEMTRERHIKESWGRFREEHPAAAKRLFEAADADGDGKLSKEERKAAREKFREYEKKRWEAFQKEHPQMAQRMKERADRNDDGKVDSFEKLEAMRKRGELEELRREKFDQNGDGKVTGEERQTERKWLEEKREERREDRREDLKERCDKNEGVGPYGRAQFTPGPKPSQPTPPPKPQPKPLGGR